MATAALVAAADRARIAFDSGTIPRDDANHGVEL